jgi:hypothetical protein
MSLKAFGLKIDGRVDGVAAEIGAKSIAGAFCDEGSGTSKENPRGSGS